MPLSRPAKAWIPKTASTFGVVERPFGDHAFGAGDPLGDRHPLFGRLEEQHDLARQAVAQAGQDLGGGEQHRGVGVVAAGVHHRHALALRRCRWPCS